MKKVVLSCMLMLMVAGSVYAASNAPVCSDSELSPFDNNRYVDLGVSSADFFQ